MRVYVCRGRYVCAGGWECVGGDVWEWGTDEGQSTFKIVFSSCLPYLLRVCL